MQASMQNRMASSRTRLSVRASAAPAVAPPKAKACKPGKDSLYLFKWTRPSGGNTEATIKQLKALEKVSKEALWFTVKDAKAAPGMPSADAALATAHQHVLVVTNDAKTAKKYQLLELEGDTPVSVSLDGVSEPVQVPLPSIRTALQQRLMMEEDSSDSSDSDEEDMMPAPNKMTNKMDKKEDKKKHKKEDKEEKDVLAALETVPENPLAAQQAAALLGSAAEAPADGGEVAELVLGMVTKQERRKLKDTVRDVERGAMTPAGMPATASMMMMEEDTSSSSSSSGSSESEDDEMDITKGKMDKKEDKKEDKKKKDTMMA